VVGTFDSSAHSRGFLFTGSLGSFKVGEPPGGYSQLEANAVNDSGRVAGYAFNGDSITGIVSAVAIIGTALDSVHTFTTLPTLGGSLAETVDNAITGCGVILGWATKTNAASPRYAVAWVPQGCTIP